MITLSELLKFEIVEDEVDNWFLMTSWVPITSIVAGYLVFVLYAGPKWMANRKPFDIKYILLVYNLAQTLINLYYSISTVLTPGSLSYIYNHTCHPIRPRSLRPLQWKEVSRFFSSRGLS
ncbi:elongation of very long chain fatty acids protein 4-like [Diaphorina citri]|uniref:Elongation of very long chain fatty acids protein n=1 Tax=Diaphorina citri TaxID=121845 RepID=A0A1S4ERF5_DIACI|nr:elongation of very long chain fatty acids protein 4-like [Diaphorina citri]XP_026688800.1 elongation of very long chain fatty acids protein 4-like [Diaphorina citri]XP_026688801.1 elongation of very long chain fatty acids protein 4-like [Diaphorina citri]